MGVGMAGLGSTPLPTNKAFSLKHRCFLLIPTLMISSLETRGWESSVPTWGWVQKLRAPWGPGMLFIFRYSAASDLVQDRCSINTWLMNEYLKGRDRSLGQVRWLISHQVSGAWSWFPLSYSWVLCHWMVMIAVNMCWGLALCQEQGWTFSCIILVNAHSLLR